MSKQAASVAAVPLHIGGRVFHSATDTTLRHDLAIQREIHRAGLEGLAPEPGEDAKLFARRLLQTACVQGDILTLLGCLLVPADVERWTPAVAEATADFLGELTDVEAKRWCKARLQRYCSVLPRPGCSP